MTEYPPTKVLLADDHTMFREGLARLLATYGGLEVVGETANGEEASALAQETRPDVVIMQVQMPFEKAQEALRRMREVTPTPKVVIVTMFEDPRMMRELLKLGASAYVLKSSSSRQLIGAVRAAVFDPLSNNVVVGMPLEALEEAQEGSGGVLTARQLEILLLAARGLSSREMAARLHIAQGTVSRHLSDVYKKLGSGRGAKPPERPCGKSGSPLPTSPKSPTHSLKTSPHLKDPATLLTPGSAFPLPSRAQAGSLC